MSAPIDQAVIVPAAPGELDSLLSAIADGIQALAAWDMAAFEAASERQRAICDHFACKPDLRQLPSTAAAAKKVQELNRVYDRLLRHSVHWARTIHSILQASGDPFPRQSSVHFRG